MQQFLRDKQAADSCGQAASPEASQALVAALHSLTGLRALLAGGLSSGKCFVICRSTSDSATIGKELQI